MALKAVVDKIDDIAEPFRELYSERNGKFELTGVEGMKTQADIDRIQASLIKERNDHKATKDKFSTFADLDLSEIQAKLDKYPELEAAAAGKLDEKQIDSLVEGRIKTRLAPLERELKTAKNALGEKDEIITKFTIKDKQRKITRAVSEAAKKAGLQDTAVEDAVLLGERVFELNEDGSVTTKDGVGCTPGIDPVVWFSEMQPKRPHWWGPSAGGGAGGNRGSNNGGMNPWAHDTWNMTEQGKILRENPTRADQLAKSAGTTVGGRKPAARK